MNSLTPEIAAVIMAGGKGSRMGVLGQDRPKCLLAVGGETLLTRLVRQLRDAGVVQIAICCSPENVNSIGAFLRTDSVAAAFPAQSVRVVSCSECRLGPLPALAQVLTGVQAGWILMCLADIYFDRSPFVGLSDKIDAINEGACLMLGTDEMLRGGHGTGFVCCDGAEVRSISYNEALVTVQRSRKDLRWSGSFLFRSELAVYLSENLAAYPAAPFESWIQSLLVSGVNCAWIDAGGFTNVNALEDYQDLVARCGNSPGDSSRQ